MSSHVLYRIEKLLEELILQEGFITSHALSKKLGVSSRTVRKDLKRLAVELEHVGITLCAVPSKGFCIESKDREKALTHLKSLKHTTPNIPTLPDERRKYLIRILLFETAHLKVDDLSKILYVSLSTVERDLQEVKDWFTKQDLDLANTKDCGITITGSERLKRIAMVNYLTGFDEVPSLPNQKYLSAIIGDEYVQPVTAIIRDRFEREKIHLSDAEFLNLIIYLSISLLRLSHHHEITQEDTKLDFVENKTEVDLAEKITSALEQRFRLNINQAEVIHLIRFLMHLNLQENHSQIVKTLSAFIEETIQKLGSRFDLDFAEDNELKSSLASYLNSLIHSAQTKPVLKNPGLGEIAAHYPDALELAVCISQELNQAYNQQLNEHEIGYIALYFCAALERIKGQKKVSKKKVVIICATGIGGSQLFAVKIRRHFPDLDIIGIYPAYRLPEAVKRKPDLIISTNPIQDIGCPVVLISHVLNDKDLNNIENTLDDMSQRGKRDLSILFRPDLFFSNIAFDTKTNVIHFLCEKIRDHGYVDNTFASAVLKREAIFSTAIGNLVAIPHALTLQFSDSWIAVGLLKKPIHWGSDLAQLILLLNIDNRKQDEFKTIYEMLYDIVNDKKMIGRLLKTTQFEEFIKVINE